MKPFIVLEKRFHEKLRILLEISQPVIVDVLRIPQLSVRPFPRAMLFTCQSMSRPRSSVGIQFPLESVRFCMSALLAETDQNVPSQEIPIFDVLVNEKEEDEGVEFTVKGIS